VTLTRGERAAIEAQAIEEYPAESCGVVLVRGAERRLLRCRNIQDELHARDPASHPRDARTAYYIDPQDLLRIGRLEGEGFSVAVIYHSHIEAGAYFSPTDRRQAMMGARPAYPDATYVVTSVVGGRVDAVNGFRWSDSDGDFVQVADILDSRSS
jgi:[CysO sulfur-carrier protein]-S-L-cysteine hydrolase